MYKFKNLCKNDVDYSRLSVQIAKFNRPAQSSGTSFSNAGCATSVNKSSLCD